MIDSTVYATYMTAIADRTKSPIAEATIALYYVTLSEQMTTGQFETAARAVFADYDDFGFPPPGVFLKALAGASPPVDVDAVLDRVSKLGEYNPHRGWIYPRPETVRLALGDAIANAYAAAGGAALFADASADGTSITRDIARRTFAKDVQVAQERTPAMPLLPAPLDTKRLAS